MRVAFDEQIFAVQRFGGISRMFAELMSQFQKGAVPGIEVLPLNAPVINRYLLDDRELAADLNVWPARTEFTALARYAGRVSKTDRPDVLHNTFYLPRGITRSHGASRVVTVHDMIPELMPHTRRRLDWLTLKRRYVNAADHIICVSEATKQDLIKVYGLTSAPISVIHHGVDERFRPNAPRLDFLPERYVLFVGHRRAYKDADVLFRAFARISTSFPDLHLLCVGGDGLTQDEARSLQDMGIRERVSQRFLPDDQMASAYAHADIFVFPSHFEGFGLPALEAMACGTPTVLAAATSLPEVGGDAAQYFEPGDSRELAGILTDLLNDSHAQRQLRDKGFERARAFTWHRAASQTAEAYAQAAERPRSS